jgi:hypothetical protein
MSRIGLRQLIGVGVLMGICIAALSRDATAAEAGDRDRQRLAEGGPAVVKQFIAQLRKRRTDEQAGDLRKFIDPRYLKAHRLEEGAFAIKRVVTGAIFDNQLTDDPATVVILAQTDGGAKEAFVFRTTMYEGQAYIQPLTPPERAGGSFTPWILRMKV